MQKVLAAIKAVTDLCRTNTFKKCKNPVKNHCGNKRKLEMLFGNEIKASASQLSVISKFSLNVPKNKLT